MRKRTLGFDDWFTPPPPPRRDLYGEYVARYGSPQPISPLYKLWGWPISEQTVSIASGGRILRPGVRR